MDSLNNWLGFSLASHLSGVQHMSEETGTAGTTTSTQNIGADFNSSGDGGRHRQEQQCFNLLASSSSLNGVAEDPSPFQTDQGCSFTMFNALGQTHNSDWGVDSLEENRQQQQQHYLQATNGINSTLYDPHHHYPPQLLKQQQQQQQQHESGMGRTNNNTSIVAPKLEDFLGGSNNVNTNNNNNSSNSTTANHEAEKSSNSSSFASSSYSQRHQQVGPNNATRDLLFHDYDSRLPLIPGYDSNYHLLSAESGHNMHHSTQAASATMGLSIMKSWLRSQNNTSSSSPRTPAVQSLSLSMSIPTIKSSCNMNKGISTTSLVSTTTATSETAALTAAESTSDIVPAVTVAETVAKPEGGGGGELELEIVPKKSIDNFGQRTSIYRGVTKHRWTGRYEAHLWDNSCRREGQTRKGRQVYLGGYDSEEKAARAYDLAALKYWGPTTTINFPLNDYENELEEMKHKTRQEFVASLRRKSTGFSRGASIYRGVTRHHQHGRWQARIGRVAGNKDLYLGTFSTQEEAAEAYDIAAIKFRGVNAVTNFEASRYDIAKICSSSSIPIAALVKRNSLDQQPRLYDDIALGSLYAMQPTRPSSWQLLGYTPPQLPIQAIPAHHHYSKPWESATQLSQEEEEASFPLSLTNTNTDLQLQNQLMATFDVSVSPFATTFPTFLSNSGTNNHNTTSNGMFLTSGAAPSSSSSSSSPSEQAMAAAMVNIGGGFAAQGNPCHVDQQLLSQLPRGSDTCLPDRNLFYSRQPFGSMKPSSSYGNYGLENDSGGTHHEWVTTVPTYTDWN